MKYPKSSFSRLSVAASERADMMQALTVAYINDQFKADTDTVDLRTMTYQDFLDALETADKNGTRQQFEASLASQLIPIVEQVMLASTQEGAPNANA